MPTVLLATFNLLPEGESGGAALVAALADHGVDARWACWDDPSVDWGSAELVAVRSTWDYHRRLSDFLAWARGIERHTQLLNGAEVFAWNADKAYLRRLPVPTVPTELLDDSDLVPGLTAALARWGGRVLVKPRTGAGGVGVVVAEGVDDPRLEGLTAGPWVVQPVVESVRTVGESSVFVIDGRAVAQVDKSVAGSAAGVGGGRRGPRPRALRRLQPTGAARPAPRAAGGGRRARRRRHHRRRPLLRAGRPDAPRGPVGGQRGGADRAGALPRRRPRDRRPVRGNGPRPPRLPVGRSVDRIPVVPPYLLLALAGVEC
ncbi:hypothetical protein [Nocardioides sp. TF02-7]|uniref:hypothetical protein n=1 Tax=Nocardioides sp. TF02-7 TaxID=2917724 RepID=UPI001F064907|nr:hypothetical protein [Nocardioides sp. TF02-7]UMG93464.1 hypothetical protein MF408_04360 [Nocardioides sp. TF02-7]